MKETLVIFVTTLQDSIWAILFDTQGGGRRFAKETFVSNGPVLKLLVYIRKIFLHHFTNALEETVLMCVIVASFMDDPLPTLALRSESMTILMPQKEILF